MASIDIAYYSIAISRVAHAHIELPNDANAWEKRDNPHYNRPVKTVFLLHGYQNDLTEWPTHAPVRETALKYNLAMVMPYGGNSFYLDAKGRGNSYCRFIGEELPKYLQNTLGLSDRREDNYIGGISMGGFGAIHTAYSYPERFERAFAMSPALIVNAIKDIPESFSDPMADYDYYSSVFGPLNELDSSRNSPEFLLRELKRSDSRIPPLFQACGTEDFLIKNNREFLHVLEELSAPHVYHEGHGTHEFSFWNKYLTPAIHFLLTGEDDAQNNM